MLMRVVKSLAASHWFGGNGDDGNGGHDGDAQVHGDGGDGCYVDLSSKQCMQCCMAISKCHVDPYCTAVARGSVKQDAKEQDHNIADCNDGE